MPFSGPTPMLEDVMEHFFTPQMIAMLVALAAQVGGFVWWASKIGEKVSEADRRLGAVETEQRSQERTLNQAQSTLARIDERTMSMVAALNRLLDERKP